MCLDYLTLTFPNNEHYNDIVIALYSGCDPKRSKAVHPYNHAVEFTIYGFPVGKIRTNGNQRNEGFTTIDLYGRWFELVRQQDIRFDKAMTLISYHIQKPEIKIARFDVKYDSLKHPTDYNPKALEVLRYYKGKGQPTYYYGNNDDLCRVYDKTQEYADVDNVYIEDQVTRFEFQLRDRYISTDLLPNLRKSAEAILAHQLLTYFGIRSQADSFKLKTYTVIKEKSIDGFKNYCTMAQSIIDLYGLDAFLNYVYVNAKPDRSKYYEQYSRDTWMNRFQWQVDKPSLEEWHSELAEINKYFTYKEENKC